MQCLRAKLFWSIEEAERLKAGKLPNCTEIICVFQKNYTSVLNNLIFSLLTNLYREDSIYANPEFTGYSMNGPGENCVEERKRLEKFSERWQRLHKGYILDRHMHIVARPETPVINLKQLMRLLRSKDEALWLRCKWMFDGKFRFLDGEPNNSQKVAFCSFPRSGNTFLRKYLELLTGIHTGSDCTLDLDVQFQMQGLSGTHTVDDTVWIAKSHSPWIMKMIPIFTANKCIVIVRNPLDSMVSMLHMASLFNHSQKVPFDFETTYPSYWDWWVRYSCGQITNWYKQMMHDSKKRQVPMIFVRYEDLVNDPEPQLYTMMRFLLGQYDLTNTNAERRIQEVLGLGSKATVMYSLKDTTKKKNTHLHRLTPEQLAHV